MTRSEVRVVDEIKTRENRKQCEIPSMPAYGVMFHHFYDDRHPRGQGAISAADLSDLLDHLGRDNILSAEEWKRRALSDALEDNDVCLTFDDALRCQYEVALPVLREAGLTAFWFVYSSVFEGNVEPLEVYRYFRTTSFASVDDFYAEFSDAARAQYPREYEERLAVFNPDEYLAPFPFYSKNDRIFRYLRDDVLGPARYRQVMSELMAARSIDARSVARGLWMTDEQLRSLHAEGHLIGLHSYSHPTRLAELSAEGQKEEFGKNSEHLSKVLGSRPECMSHPCNSYGPETLRLLENLGVRLGFRANMQKMASRTNYEFPREDHANIMKKLRS